MRPLAATLLISLLIVLDQVSKWATVVHLPFQRDVDLAPFLALFHTYNYGIAFSMLAGLGAWGLVLVGLVVLVVVCVLWWQTPRTRTLAHVAFAMIVAGAVGNLIDRVSLGYVVDMIRFHLPDDSWSFAVFNLADTWISLGAALIVIDELVSWRRGRAASQAGQTPDE